MPFRMNLVVLLELYVIYEVGSQFPSSCTDTKSLASKTCCPVPIGLRKPCGSPARGECVEVSIENWTDRFIHYQEFHKFDDRSNWPKLFYTKACKCMGHFAGYDCSKCKFGFRGIDCKEKKKPVIRNNVQKLTKVEKDKYMRVINMSRYVISDYKVATTFYHDMKSNGSFTPNFLEVSIYDLFVWLHYYATRNTYLRNDTEIEEIDFAHEGQGFPTWHRLYLLLLEESLQEISGDETFAIPYWDWTSTTNCDICTEDFVGKSDKNGNVHGKYFTDNAWYMICIRELIGKNDDEGLRICDPRKHKVRGLARRPGTDTDFKLTKLPRKKEVDFVLCFETFDRDPYNKMSEKNFRNTLEGYTNTKTGEHSNEDHTLHNQVHIYLGGSLPNQSHEVKPGKYLQNGVMKEVLAASNDPIFFFHHSFIDRIFEKWLRMYNKNASKSLHQSGAPIGHNSGSPIVPFFPYWIQKDLFRKSSEFGYNYEDVDEKGMSSNDGELDCDKTKSDGTTCQPLLPALVIAFALYETLLSYT